MKKTLLGIFAILSITLVACAPPSADTPAPAPATLPAPTSSPAPAPSPTGQPVPQLYPAAMAASLGAYPLQLGSVWHYASTHYDTYETRRITATYRLTETVTAVVLNPPYYAAQLHRAQTLLTPPDDPPADWEQFYLAGGDAVRSHWLVISGTQVFEQDALDWAAVETGQAALAYRFPLAPNLMWYPDPAQRAAHPEFDLTPGLRFASPPAARHTPAGDFDPCFEIVTMYNSGPTRQWFCPGAGVAASQYDHGGTPFGSRTALTSYTLPPDISLNAPPAPLRLTLLVDRARFERPVDEITVELSAVDSFATFIIKTPMFAECFASLTDAEIAVLHNASPEALTQLLLDVYDRAIAEAECGA